MLAGAKLGDIWGRDRTFAIGLAVYAPGLVHHGASARTSASCCSAGRSSRASARRWWCRRSSSLIAANYEGKERALAFGIVGGVAGGGDRGRAADRRLGDDRAQLALRVRRRGRDRRGHPARPQADEVRRRANRHPPKLDVVGVALSASGLGVIVFGSSRAATWGLIEPRGALTINGTRDHAVRLLGRAVPDPRRARLPGRVRAVGGAPRAARSRRAARLARCSGSSQLRAGLSTLMMQQLILLGHVLRAAGLPAGRARARRVRDRQAAVPDVGDDVHRGACSGPRLAAGFAPKRVAQAGLRGARRSRRPAPRDDRRRAERDGFAIALAVFGVGAGLLLSQLGNVIMSSVDPSKTNEAGGLQGTAQNLGASLGTALIGAVLLIGLTTGSSSAITANEELPAEVRTAVAHSGERAGPRGHSGHGGRAVPDGRRPPARPGGGDRDGLRRRAARRPAACPRRGRAVGAARPVLHAQPARPVDRWRTIAVEETVPVAAPAG